MLQQTRVAAVIPYYERFLAAYPDPPALANAPEDQLLALWSGLGYYSRARNLQKAAQQMGVTFPTDYDSIRGLPGVGDYTAAAVASIAFDLPHAAVDGNVRRVVVRLTNDDQADAAAIAAKLLDRKRPGRWNQAMMELGATVCTPRDPQCGACPAALLCEAHRAGTQREIPSKRAKPETVRLTKTVLIVRDKDRVLLTPSERVQGFWDFPEEIPGATEGPVIGEFKHAITFRQYRFRVRRAKAGRVAKPLRWVAEKDLHEIPLSTTAKKALRCLEKARV
jgi:A/G-specific adenine glycosylase